MPGPDPRSAPLRPADPGTRRHRRLQQPVPGPHPRPTRPGPGHPLLRRPRHHRTHPRRLAHIVDEPDLWIPALDQDADLRDHAEICEITDLVDTSAHPTGTRVIVRRELPHPGAQLSLFDHIVGWRHQLLITDTPHGHGPIQYLEARHRAHARVEDRIRCGKNTGLGRFPSREFAINTVWLELALTAIDLLAWTKTLLLNRDLATTEPKKLRYRLLHVAAPITRSGRRTRLRIAENWPWATDLVNAFTRLAALPQPVT